MWWLNYLVGMALLVMAWAAARAWWRRRPSGPIDDVKLRNRPEAAAARERRKLYKWAQESDLYQ
jgi:hypothetical protein